MKSDKLKKLLKQIKKLKKLKNSRKSKTVKKSINKNVKLSAELDNLKQKIKNQEVQLSQIRNPQPAPVSRVNYEMLGIGQQNALNQSNLENIEKKIETKLRNETEELINYYDQQQNFNQQPNFNVPNSNKYSHIIEGIESGKLKVKPTKYGVNITDTKLYKKPGRPLGSKTKKAINESAKSSGITNIINSTGTPQKQIYSLTDNSGEFPNADFNTNFNEETQQEIIQPLIDENIGQDTVQIDQLKDAEKFVDTGVFTDVKPKRVRKTKNKVETIDEPPVIVEQSKVIKQLRNKKTKN